MATDDSIETLRNRLAKGEISIEEYEKLKEVLCQDQQREITSCDVELAVPDVHNEDSKPTLVNEIVFNQENIIIDNEEIPLDSIIDISTTTGSKLPFTDINITVGHSLVFAIVYFSVIFATNIKFYSLVGQALFWSPVVWLLFTQHHILELTDADGKKYTVENRDKKIIADLTEKVASAVARENT